MSLSIDELRNVLNKPSLKQELHWWLDIMSLSPSVFQLDPSSQLDSFLIINLAPRTTTPPFYALVLLFIESSDARLSLIYESGPSMSPNKLFSVREGFRLRQHIREQIWTARVI